tara:strand:+ start:1721 stop:2326 length:606 start_codon:yes stop_codon:yes gene_type:complete
MKIGIDINEVLRDFIGQFAYTYEKYIGELDIEENPVDSFDLIKHFKFETVDDMNKFLFMEASLEVFGHADQLHENLMAQLNMFLMDIKDEEEHEIIITSKEVAKSIPSTYFFLSKLGCRADKIIFVSKYEDIWDNIDLLITANPKALETKPNEKISVKVNSSYNKTSGSDFELDSIIDFIKDSDLREKILNTRITTYEEIK